MLSSHHSVLWRAEALVRYRRIRLRPGRSGAEPGIQFENHCTGSKSPRKSFTNQPLSIQINVPPNHPFYWFGFKKTGTLCWKPNQPNKQTHKYALYRGLQLWLRTDSRSTSSPVTGSSAVVSCILYRLWGKIFFF